MYNKSQIDTFEIAVSHIFKYLSQKFESSPFLFVYFGWIRKRKYTRLNRFNCVRIDVLYANASKTKKNTFFTERC